MDNYVGEIRIVGFNFAPTGWAFCDGQLLSIAQNTALFSLLGTYYGGDGKSTFALPNLQGNVALGQGHSDYGVTYSVGDAGGEPNHTLSIEEMPSHNHPLMANNLPATTTSPRNAVYAQAANGTKSANLYASPSNGFGSDHQIYPTGGGLPHDNMQPYLVMNFIIALQGIFPARN